MRGVKPQITTLNAKKLVKTMKSRQLIAYRNMVDNDSQND